MREYELYVVYYKLKVCVGVMVSDIVNVVV